MTYQNLVWHQYRLPMIGRIFSDDQRPDVKVRLIAWTFRGDDLLVLTASGRVTNADHYDLIHIERQEPK